MFLILGTLLTISSNSWIFRWLGFEINVISFIPLLIYNLNYKLTEATIKYFLVQALASRILLIFFLKERIFSYNLFRDFSLLIFLSICIKMGVAPFHIWFPQVAKTINWTIIFILLTWQKVAPLFILNIFSNYLFFIIMAISTSYVGAMGGINQNFLKIILSYSSINHRGWLILLSASIIKITCFYFLIYSSIIFFLRKIRNLLRLKSIKDVNTRKLNLLEKIFVSINILSLSGMPPFIGFFIKAFTVFYLLSFFSPIVPTFLIFARLISLVFYIKIFFSITFVSSLTFKNIFLTKKLFNKIKLLILSVLLLNLILPLLVLLI